MSETNHCHPLQHRGATQIGRLAKALSQEAFRLDERTIQELIVEAHRFARTLRFFDETNTQPEGAWWDRFWEVEILTYLAIVAAADTDEMRRQYQELDEQFGKAKPVPGETPKAPEASMAAYRPLLENLRILALSLEEAYQKLVRIQHPLQTLLLNRIRRDNCCDEEELEGALKKLIGYHKGAVKGLSMSLYAGFFSPDKRWGIENKVDYDAVAANPRFSQDDLRELFHTFYNTWVILRNAAQVDFEAELARMELPEDVEYRIVQPHIVLFLVFLRLFRYAQESLNDLGDRHLAFYYEEVLGLKRRGEIPDEVYLLFELAKDFDQHLLEKGTEFLAGKDKNGQPLLFETVEDWVLRPAQVADIKNTWIDLQCGGIHANPDVSKAYENGAEKPNESATFWRSMGDDRHLPHGEVGFAIASPQLILREGKRVVDIKLTLTQKITDPQALRAEYFQVFLSSKDTWIAPKCIIEASPDLSLPLPELNVLERSAFWMKFTTPTPANQLSEIQLRVVLERDAPPVEQLGESLAAEAGFDTQWPILKIIINPFLEKPCPTDMDQNLTTAAVYEMLRTLSIRQAEINVDVRGIRENLIIQSDQGIFDGTQKVFPFGPAPEAGNYFYVGSTEVFQKALSDLKVNIQWIGAPEDFASHYTGYPVDVNWAPKVQIDFIDKADITRPEPTGRIDIEQDPAVVDLQQNRFRTVVGTAVELQNSQTGNLSVSVNNQNPLSFSQQGNNHNINLQNVPFGALLLLSKSSRSYQFQLGRTNRFKVFLLPPGLIPPVVRKYKPTTLVIEAKDENGSAIPDLKVQLGTQTLTPNSASGGYEVTSAQLKNSNLSIRDSAEQLQTTVLDRADYDVIGSSNEFEQFSKIDVKLYGTVPQPLPATPSAVSGSIKVLVVDRAGSPIHNAYVSIYKNTTVYELQTDADGVVIFNGIADSDGDWTIQAFYDGARSGRIQAEGGAAYVLRVSDEIKLTDPFKGVLNGRVSGLDMPNPSRVWGARFFEVDTADNMVNPNDPFGETNEDGVFTLANVPNTARKIRIIHEAFEDYDVEIEDNAELEITLIPKPTYQTYSGRITEVFDATKGVANVIVNVNNTGIKVKTDVSGNFTIHIPTNLTNPELVFTKSGYKTILIDQFPDAFSSIRIALPEANPVDLLVTNQENKKVIRTEFEVAINPDYVKRDPRTQSFSRYSPTLKRGFLRFKLTNADFFHMEYPKVLVRQSLALSGWNGQGTAPSIPNPPYSPATNFISIDYTSTQIITGPDNGDHIDQYYHLLPFNGHKWLSLKAVPPAPEVKVQMIYPYMPDDTLPVMIKNAAGNDVPAPYAPGNLFIGISQLQPGGALSLLFQVAEGTEPEPEALAPAIHWSYLTKDNRWAPFKTGEIISDNTAGLTRSGMIQFAIPSTAVKENTMLNAEYFWLRAAARQADLGKAVTKVQALPSMTGIRAQAVKARFKNAGNELSHLGAPLPAETVTKLLESRTAVKKVEQPLESFGGRLPESMGRAFYHRVAERLRHKDRAVTAWDFEHLLLERFPEAAAAKCIPHTRYKPAGSASELAPGYVTVVVIPDLKKRKGEPWEEPRFTQGALDDMRAFLASRSNLCVAFGEVEEAHLQVLNPLYEKVDVMVIVAFKPGVDEAFFKQQLETELRHYISPWLADPGRPPAFGRTLERSAILQFIEERPYIDYVDLADAGPGAPSKFLVRMQVIDKAGRPVVFTHPDPPMAGTQEIVTTIKSKFLTGKVCPSTARSILVAGSIVVGSVNDPVAVKLPPMPAVAHPVSAAQSGGTGTQSRQRAQAQSAQVVAIQETAEASGQVAAAKPVDTGQKTAARKSRTKKAN